MSYSEITTKLCEENCLRIQAYVATVDIWKVQIENVVKVIMHIYWGMLST